LVCNDVEKGSLLPNGSIHELFPTFFFREIFLLYAKCVPIHIFLCHYFFIAIPLHLQIRLNLLNPLQKKVKTSSNPCLGSLHGIGLLIILKEPFEHVQVLGQTDRGCQLSPEDAEDLDRGLEVFGDGGQLVVSGEALGLVDCAVESLQLKVLVHGAVCVLLDASENFYCFVDEQFVGCLALFMVEAEMA
jgi:hypothetical protein